MKTTSILVAVLLSVIFAHAQDQTPVIFSVRQVVAGAQKADTLYALAEGKWSDADDHLGVLSTEIHCYDRFGFCEEADATYYLGQAGATLNSFDILRWDKRELIAVDSSPLCVVITLRFDFAAKKVTIATSLKGETKSYCKDTKATTAFSSGLKDELQKKTK